MIDPNIRIVATAVYLLLNDDPTDAATDKIVGLVETGRSALAPILLEVSTVKP